MNNPAKSLLTIHIRPSKLLAVILIVSHCVTAYVLWQLSIPLSLKSAVLSILVISLYVYSRQDALLSFAHAAVFLRFSDNVDCAVETSDGHIIDCSVLGSTFVSSYLTVLMLQPKHCWFTRSVVILPDAIDAEEFRRLRILLRWKWKQVSGMNSE